MILDVVTDFDILFARNAAKQLATSIGFSKEDRTRIDLAISELAHNLVFHAGQGKLFINKINLNGRTGFEAISKDLGPGINDVEQALQLGFSTKGTLGTGLNSTKEVMDEFFITSQSGIGTTVIVRKWLK